MAPDVEVPDPPSLTGPQERGPYEAVDMADQEAEDDYRHEELEGFLREGAWQDAFEEWAGETYLDVHALATLDDRHVYEGFDFYWDPASDDVGYRSPELSTDDREAFENPDDVEEALDALGRIVTEVLENDYLLRDEEEFGFFTEEYTGDEGEEPGV